MVLDFGTAGRCGNIVLCRIARAVGRVVVATVLAAVYLVAFFTASAAGMIYILTPLWFEPIEGPGDLQGKDVVVLNSGRAEWVPYGRLAEYFTSNTQASLRLDSSRVKQYQRDIQSSLPGDSEVGALVQVRRETSTEQWIRTGWMNDGFSYLDYKVENGLVTPLATARTGPGLAFIAMPFGVVALAVLSWLHRGVLKWWRRRKAGAGQGKGTAD